MTLGLVPTVQNTNDSRNLVATYPNNTIHIENDKVFDIVSAVLTECIKAYDANPPMHSLHEGFAVILEEMDELKAEVWKNPRKHPDRDLLARKEAIQLAAMAFRLLYDVL